MQSLLLYSQGCDGTIILEIINSDKAIFLEMLLIIQSNEKIALVL